MKTSTMSVSFHFIPHQTMRCMLEDAFELITLTESWDWLHKYPANKGFMNVDSRRLKYFKKVLELEQEKGEWGFRALKQMIKIYFKSVRINSFLQNFF